MSRVISQMLTKGWRVGVVGWARLYLKMEADHDGSPETRLQSCADSLVADV